MEDRAMSARNPLLTDVEEAEAAMRWQQDFLVDVSARLAIAHKALAGFDKMSGRDRLRVKFRTGKAIRGLRDAAANLASLEIEAHHELVKRVAKLNALRGIA
jgi:hypothetical protein